MNEKIKEIAEFDGWVVSKHQTFHGRVLYIKDGAYQWLDSMSYIYDLNALHRVALDVMNRLDLVVIRHDIMSAFRCPPANGQYTDLVDAVYDAIVYLKNTTNANRNNSNRMRGLPDV